MAYLILNLETGDFLQHWVQNTKTRPSGMIEIFSPRREKVSYSDKESAKEAIQKLRDSELYEIVEYDR